jgi:hypothetical protein
MLDDRTVDLNCGGVFLRPLARTNDGDLVAVAHEAVNEVPQRHGDAVDFGGVGLGD